MFVLPFLFLKTTSDELGVYSDFTLLTSIKSWVQVPLLPLLQILLKPEAEPKEVKAPDGGAGGSVPVWKIFCALLSCSLS